MADKKKGNDVEKVKKELLESYEKQLNDIFAPETFNLTFDELEKLVDKKVDKERTEIMQEHMEKRKERVRGRNKEPEETCLCACGTEAILRRDKEGKPEIFERTIQTKRGHVKIKEYGYYCSKDRKLFFPSAKRT